MSYGDVEPATEGERARTVAEVDQEESPRDELPLDLVFEMLRNRRRRLVVQYLTDVSETTTLSDLAERIAAVENDKPEEALTSAERKRVYVGLYQCHLPKLDDAGIVEFDSDRGTVTLTGHAEQLGTYLEREVEVRDGIWSRYYAALALVGGGALLAQQLLHPDETVSHLVIGTFIGSVGLLSVVDTYYSHRRQGVAGLAGVGGPGDGR